MPESLGKPGLGGWPRLARDPGIVSHSAEALLEARHMPLPASAEGARDAPTVAFSHVSLAFDDLVVLDDLSFSLPKGAMRILLGESGSGKSVVLKLILGLLRPDAGTIVVNGHRVDTMAERDLLRVRESIGMVFQEDLASTSAQPLSSLPALAISRLAVAWVDCAGEEGRRQCKADHRDDEGLPRNAAVKPFT